jgi:HEAT repeat protein
MASAAEEIKRAELLGDRVNGAPEHVPEVLPELLRMLESERRVTVLAAVIQALGHAWDEQASLSVVPFASHASAAVRLAAVRSMMGGLESSEATEQVIATLIERSNDPDSDVRDWATFGIGTMLDADSPAIRSTLRDRLNDSDDIVRCEALVGLARRQDPVALDLTSEWLQAPTVWLLVVEAAALLGSSTLLTRLEALKAWWDVDVELLELAIRACRAETPVEPIERILRRGAPQG